MEPWGFHEIGCAVGCLTTLSKGVVNFILNFHDWSYKIHIMKQIVLMCTEVVWSLLTLFGEILTGFSWLTCVCPEQKVVELRLPPFLFPSLLISLLCSFFISTEEVWAIMWWCLLIAFFKKEKRRRSRIIYSEWWYVSLISWNLESHVYLTYLVYSVWE